MTTEWVTPWASFGLVPPGSSVGTGIQYLGFDPGQIDPRFGVDDEWLRAAELILVEPVDLGGFTTSLSVGEVPAPKETGR